MPSVENKTFKLKLTTEDCSICVGEWENFYPLVFSNPFTVDALDFTQWEIYLYPRTKNDGCIVSKLRRASLAGEQGDISFQLTSTIRGKDGRAIHETEMVINNLGPKQQVRIDILPTAELPMEDLENDRLVVCHEFRRILQDTSDVISSGMWKDEMRVLSEDMRKLLKSSYQSDVKLESSDGRLIPVHYCILFSRWSEMMDALRERPSVVACPNVTGRILAPFVSYLYTGTIPASDVTIDLFEFVVTRFPTSRNKFYTLPQEMSMQSIPRKESIAFKWWYEGGGASFHRALPIMETIDGEILVHISTLGSHLDVSFSLSTTDECVHLKVTATLISRNGRFRKSSDHYFDFESEFDSWHFPDFIPMDVLNDDPKGIRVEFELSATIGPDWTSVDSTVTEFWTGSRYVYHVEMLSFGFGNFFTETSFLDLCDVELRVQESFFRGCKAVLGVRSEVLQKLFLDHPKTSRVQLEVHEADSKTLSSVLEYLHTGWTEISSIKEALKIDVLATKWSLHGLVRKCEQYICACFGRHLL